MTDRYLVAGALALAMTVTLVNAQGQRETPPGPANAQGQRETSTPAPVNAQSFINDLAIAGMAEVELGKLAAQQAQNADVKAFGQMMVKDHTQANTELLQIAKQMNVTPPAQLDAKHRELVDRLSKLKGAEFDREYMDAMVPGHEEVAAKLRTMSGEASTSTSAARGGQSVGTTGSDAALKKWAAQAVPTVQKHLERAKQLQAKVR